MTVDGRHDLVEKATVFRRAMEGAVDQTAAGEHANTFPEARVFASYAFMLANDGALELSRFYAHLLNLPIVPSTGRVVDAVADADPAVQELMCLRHRVHIAAGYDPSTAPLLPVYHPPAPIATPFASTDASYGYGQQPQQQQQPQQASGPVAALFFLVVFLPLAHAASYPVSALYLVGGVGVGVGLWSQWETPAAGGWDTSAQYQTHGGQYGQPAGYGAAPAPAYGAAPAPIATGYGAAPAAGAYGTPAAGYGGSTPSAAYASSGYGAPASHSHHAPAHAPTHAPAHATPYAPAAHAGHGAHHAPAPAPAPASTYAAPGYYADAHGTAYTAAPAPTPAPAAVPAAAGGWGQQHQQYTAPVPVPVERRELHPDGFGTSVGNPVSAARYGNVTTTPAAPVAPPPPAPEVNPFTADMETILRTLQALAAHLETAGVTPVRTLGCECCLPWQIRIGRVTRGPVFVDVAQPERKSISDAKRALEILEHKMRSGQVQPSTVARLQELAGGTPRPSFRRRCCFYCVVPSLQCLTACSCGPFFYCRQLVESTISRRRKRANWQWLTWTGMTTRSG